MNPSATQLLKLLQDQHAALYTKMGTVTDPKMGQAILLESQELLHRINLTQNLVMIAVAASVTTAVATVASADQQLTRDLQGIADVTKFLNAMGTYLGYVDKAIDLMKAVV